ncbi:hypothetical protein ScPMuIL_000493 [Solemya velum]
MDDDDESYIFLGSQLEPYDDDEPRKKLMSPADLQVRDSKGRVRFHGAFTGGFSAGYFNTAGSKEGFVPTTFSSSKKDKAEKIRANPEDFMDDEDLGEHGIKPKSFLTTDQFSSEQRKQVRTKTADALSRGSLISGEEALMDLIIPERLTIGVKILRLMGWKDGQGVGPRLKRKKKAKPKPGIKLYGCALPEPSEDEDDVPEFLENIKFAPKDVCPISFQAKDNVHGIGYRGLDPQLALPSTHINLFSSNQPSKQKSIGGQAFGVGALEDEDDDIYTVDNISSYDITMGEDEEHLFGWTAPSSQRKGQHQKPLEYVGKVLPGFTLSSIPLKKNKLPEPLPIPRNFKAHHKFTKCSSAGTEMKHNAVTRALVLGEKPIRTQDSSTEKLPPDRKENSITPEREKRRSRFSSPKVNPDLTTVSNVLDGSPLDTSSSRFSRTASEFKPFLKDAQKQERYDKYLTLVKENKKDAYEQAVLASGHLTEWEQDQEKEEFMKASRFYRPLQGLMASRFTTAKFEDGKTVPEAEQTVVDERVKATEMKMYGKLTHDSFEWHPDRVLCKRFNVSDPYPDSSLVGVPKVKHGSSFDYMFSVQGIEQTRLALPPPPPEILKEKTPDLPVSSKQATESQQIHKEHPKSIFSSLFEKKNENQVSVSDKVDSSQQNESMVVSDVNKEEQPTEDLFKAIFKNTDTEDSSSSSDDDEVNTDKTTSGRPERIPSLDRIQTSHQEVQNSARSMSPMVHSGNHGNDNERVNPSSNTDTVRNQAASDGFDNMNNSQKVTSFDQAIDSLRKRKHKSENRDKHKKKKRKKEKHKVTKHRTDKKKKKHSHSQSRHKHS